MLGGADDVEMLTRRVGVALGIVGGGQRADPNFDVNVAKPAYTDSHPRVLIDEAHRNFHTAGGRYKPFAELATSDGCKVVPNRAKFSKESLEACDILVIANALVAASKGERDGANPAFTDIECEVLRQWVEGGGSLLLITDHAPMGSAAECLAKKFGVAMSKGATTDEANCAEGRLASLMFTQANKLLADHPITRGRNESERISRVRTFTGQSLKGSPRSLPIMKLADTAVDHVDGNEVSAAQVARDRVRVWHGPRRRARRSRDALGTGCRRRHVQDGHERRRHRQQAARPQHPPLALRTPRAQGGAAQEGSVTTIVRPWFGRGTCASHVSAIIRACAFSHWLSDQVW